MKKQILSILKKIGYGLVVDQKIKQYFKDIYSNQVAQKNIYFQFKNFKNSKEYPKFNETGFQVYSQNDEDGKLLYIFALLGFTNKIVVDVACGRPFGSNTANLIINWGFQGLLIDDDKETIDSSVEYYKSHANTLLHPPKVIKQWIDAENINKIFEKEGIKGEIDLLSIDVSGVDYWLWKKLSVVQPRVILIEYNSTLGPDRSITVPYSKKFNRFDNNEHFFGCSLKALIKLGKEKGYIFIGTNECQYNGFFIRKDLYQKILKPDSIESYFTHMKVIEEMETIYPEIKKLPWVTV